MRTVYNMLQAAQKLQLESLQQEAMSDSTAEYVDLQKDQLFEGIRSDDKPIFNVKTGKDTYSPDYALYKGYTKPIDLKDKGNFYNGIYAEPGSDGLIIDSKDSKSNMLQENYGDEILGLGKRYRPEWLEVVEEHFVTGIEKVIG